MWWEDRNRAIINLIKKMLFIYFKFNCAGAYEVFNKYCKLIF